MPEPVRLNIVRETTLAWQALPVLGACADRWPRRITVALAASPAAFLVIAVIAASVGGVG